MNGILLNHRGVKFDDGVTDKRLKTNGSPSHNFRKNAYHVSSEFSPISTPGINIVGEDVVNDPIDRKKRKECKVIFSSIPCGVKTTKIMVGFSSLFFGQRIRDNSDTIW